MASKDNKGFSLTEVVVSVAVLLLLLSPILSQMLTSIKTQSLAKERLYALENANSVLEVVKSADVKDIESHKGSLFDVVDLNPANAKESFKSGTKKCKIYVEDTSGNIVALKCKHMVENEATGEMELKNTEVEISYNYTDYILSDAIFGKGMYKYSRVATIDDLANKVKSFEEYLVDDGSQIKHYNIVYGLPDSYEEKTIGGYSFSRTNEGSYVSYDYEDYSNGDKNNIAHVNAILVKENTLPDSTYSDPNAIDLGHIQDLDETKVAIVEGAGSNFDTQAETDFLGLKMDSLKEVNRAQWEMAMMHEKGESIFTTGGYSETVNKHTNVKLEQAAGTGGLTKYMVTVTVTYEDNYTLPVAGGGNRAFRDFLTYRVYHQEFYTDRCPDVYLMYEPYVYNSTKSPTTGLDRVQYRSADYISVDNQLTMTVDAEGKVKETLPHMYVIRPDNTKFDVVLNGYQDEESFKNQIADKVPTGQKYYEDVYYTDISGDWKPISIVFFQSGTKTTSDEEKIIPIYTDIPFTYDSDESDNLKKQYFSVKTPNGFCSEVTVPEDEEEIVVNKPFDASLSTSNVKEYFQSKIKDISSESRSGDGRLFTATVTYRRLNKDGSLSSGYDIRFQSGKGAD